MRTSSRLIRHLEQRIEELDAENARLRASIVELSGATGPFERPIIVGRTHDEATCRWKKMQQGQTDGYDGRWECEHGVIVHAHPNGWCDQGCCR